MACLTQIRHNIIASQPHIATVSSGNTADSSEIAHFKTDVPANVKELKVTFAASQSGSGDPSASNIRPISGYNSISVTRAGVNLLEVTNTIDIASTLPDTCYGGYLDLVSGELVVTHVATTISQISGWQLHNNTTARQAWKTFSISSKGVARNVAVNCIGDRFKSVSWDATWKPWNVAPGEVSGSGILICVPSGSYSTAEQMIADIGSATLCYELVTPQTYSITPQTLKTLCGINNIWSDQGTVEVKYWTH